jgi:hypothetical protein
LIEVEGLGGGGRKKRWKPRGGLRLFAGRQ